MMNFLNNRNPTFLNRPLPLFLLISIFIVGMFMASCSSIKPYVYFKDLSRDTTLPLAPLSGQQLVIQKGDVLTILISSLSRLEDEVFNAKTAQGGYEVDDEGMIYLQRLGRIRAEGLTRRQLKQRLETDLKPYLKDPLVAVNFANHKVTIIGSVNKSQVLQMPGEQITLFDALAQSGNVQKEAEISKIIVLRDSGNTHKIVKNVNLEDKSFFASPFYHLQPNDVVIVNANERLLFDEQNRMRYQQLSTITIQTITLGVLIYQTFFR